MGEVKYKALARQNTAIVLDTFDGRSTWNGIRRLP